MAIINRDVSRSERQVENQAAYNSALATGVTSLLAIAPYNCLLTGVNVAAFGLSGSPVWTLNVFRFAGGLTSIPLSATLAVGTFGTSGCLGFSLAAPGITLLAGDALTLVTGGANSAVATAVVTSLFSPLADIKTYQNSVV